MSHASRESIHAALFAALQSVPGLITVSRTLENVQDMAAEMLPAAFQLQGKQVVTYRGSVPAIVEMQATWIFYAYSPDPNIPSSGALNNLIDAACAAIAPPAAANASNTLGGLVQYVGIAGDIEVFEGVLGSKAVAILPLRMLFPGF